MTEKTITCVTCPIGCSIVVRGEGDAITHIEGNQCKRGEAYARDEFVRPVRTLTTTVRVQGGAAPLVAVRSSAPVPKALLLPCMEAIRKASIAAPVARHDVVIPDILGTGVDIIATGEVD